jgi:16S rRNA G966 N2-methylase RsmD
MPTLDWIGKKAVINHHRQVPYRLLHCDDQLSAGDRNAGNLLVQGDNLQALKALLPYYAGQVKCIYIDPPYNTGNEGWVYNDNVNSPEIRKWLGEVVGKEADDLSRHDKWLRIHDIRHSYATIRISAGHNIACYFPRYSAATGMKICRAI